MSLFLRRFPLLRRDPRHEDVMHHLSRGAVGDVSFCAVAATRAELAARAPREPNYYLQRRDCKIALPLPAFLDRPRAISLDKSKIQK